MDEVERQKDLPLRKYRKALVIGAGGIGFWVTVFLALSRCVREIHVVDPDRLERVNLNRLFIPVDFIGMNKAEAVAEYVKLVVDDVKVIPFADVFDESWDIGSYDLVIESTDSLDVQRTIKIMAEKYKDTIIIGVHYNGVNDIAIEVNKFSDVIGTGYVTTPSFIAPCVLASALAVYVALTLRKPDDVYIRWILPGFYVYVGGRS